MFYYFLGALFSTLLMLVGVLIFFFGLSVLSKKDIDAAVDAAQVADESKRKLDKVVALSLGFILFFGGMTWIFNIHQPVSDKVNSVKFQGQAIGSRLSSIFAGYTSFGDGKSGSMTAKGKKANAILVSPMHNAIGGDGTRKVNVYGVETFKPNTGSGPGLVEIKGKTYYNAYNITSANYGTKLTGTDLSWCFVLHDYGVYVKFTNKSNGYPWSLKPITCVNGR